MTDSNAFSPNYITARERFRAASSSLGYSHTAYPINQVSPKGEELTIDVAISSAEKFKRVVVISSGLHGVEGFLGSAIQLILLEKLKSIPLLPADTKLVLIHALNPYGFAWRRRWNENNIDLNRNFLLSGKVFEGSPQDYSKFNSFLNPTSPPSLFEPYLIKAIWLIFRYGMTSLKNTLPVGQYDFPKGLFWGGHAPSKTQEILATNLPLWINNAPEVMHIDFHTGLGAWGTYKLFPRASKSSDQLVKRFGADAIQYLSSESVSYEIRGGLGAWCQSLLPDSNYECLTAEFGTYSLIQVLKALRAENRAYFWGKPHQNYEWTKHQLLEMFAPESPKWREQCLTQGIDICKQALMNE
ncbi:MULTISPECIES: M14 family metallopeptidase [Planktothrix]|jgi:Protein of unknown function (DUF2817)|uniref:DUF2817 domain-containing protein n=2 Tax=Planktothrix TaxID=54304 RepID=A0A479ZU98_PLAAG|nr:MULTISPECIES: M14 family metallopeptidase [Planktothrix]CAD5972132.1 hypothetical protein NO108_04223 [Planktothrix rubescens]CAC5342777.1 conserved hypothetical protein [Planktothrix rubescens NIVA-CYA 18]CAD5973134.1 hypothetical protein PCC7821_03922 [Planktothrix rubescens NIVA-CYA 18]CAH2574473.1 hypothetical protein PRNO82_03833 [Planktothrix rubescens]GCL34831.1 hypothetical protein PA905_18110 [Planktothrix agardhii CCAP 1459/11A]